MQKTKKSKYTEKQLQMNILEEQLSGHELYYSYVNKPGKTLGLNIRRLLLFDKSQDILTYMNQETLVPFEDLKKLEKRTKQHIIVSWITQINRPPKTNKLLLRYSTTLQATNKSMNEWTLQFTNQNITLQWKNKLQTHIRQGKQQIRVSQNRDGKFYYDHHENDSADDKFIHSVLGGSALRETKLQGEINRLNSDNFIKNSRVEEDKNAANSGVKESGLKQSDVKPFNSNISDKNKGNQSKFNSSQLNQRSVINFGRQTRINTNDWNLTFIENPTLATIKQFEEVACEAVKKLIDQDLKNSRALRVYSGTDNASCTAGLTVKISDVQTVQANQLKREFQNYHYILQSCSAVQLFDQSLNQKSQSQHHHYRPILGVPMCCIVQISGVVALVKASFPHSSQIVSNKNSYQNILGQLQKYTKISNTIIYRSNCVLLDISEAYGSEHGIPRIYIDNLIEYLPYLSTSLIKNTRRTNQQSASQLISNKFSVRPKLLQYHINRIINGGELKLDQQNSNKRPANAHLPHATNIEQFQHQIYKNFLTNQIKQTARYLSSEDIYIENIFDLKEYLHQRGLNVKLLAYVVQNTENKFVKKYLQTCLVAKLIKDQIWKVCGDVMYEGRARISMERVVEKQLKCFIEGNSAENNEYWKKIINLFLSTYGFPLNTRQIEGGFLLSCFMILFPCTYRLEKIDKSKNIFEDDGIIEEGFIEKIGQKTKSYYRYIGHPRDKVVETCKYSIKDRKTYEKIVDQFNLQSEMIPHYYQMNQGKLYILAYLSDYVAARDMYTNTLPCASEIYSRNNINHEPPSTPTIKITLSYLNQCLQQKKYQQFKQIIDKSIVDMNFWLGDQHPQICDFYDYLSDYQASQGCIEKSIQIMKRSIEISLKAESKNYKKLGIRYYALGNRNLTMGHKKQAMNNLLESKRYLQKIAIDDNQLGSYPLMLMKLSSLYLNNGDIIQCIQHGNQALKYGQKMMIKESQLIKMYEILCRAYEIVNDSDNLKKLSMKCSKYFNNCKQANVFDEMIKIGLTGIIAQINKQKSMSLLKLAKQLNGQNSIKNHSQSLNQLMQLAQTMAVMEKFNHGCRYADKIHSDVLNKKPLSGQNQEFLRILALVVGTVSLDFLEGLNAQKDD